MVAQKVSCRTKYDNLIFGPPRTLFIAHVCVSDGLLTVKASNRVARKPGQTRRPKACRAQTNKQ